MMSSASPQGDRIPGQIDWHDRAFDLTRGIAVYTGSRLIQSLAMVVARHPEADIGTAFNRKQVACKLWARDKLHEHCGGRFDRIWIVGGWYGILGAMLCDDPRFEPGLIESIDIDPLAGPVAATMLAGMTDRFAAVTADMYSLDYAGQRPDLVVNTSCEHILDLRGWLDLVPRGTRVLLQSNDYVREPSHVNCMPSAAAFSDAASLSHVAYTGELPMQNYTRFMLIGTV